MEPTITTKLGAVKQIAENIVLLAEAKDYEGAAYLGEELMAIASIPTDKVIIEDCPMSASGIIINQYPKAE